MNTHVRTTSTMEDLKRDPNFDPQLLVEKGGDFPAFSSDLIDYLDHLVPSAGFEYPGEATESVLWRSAQRALVEKLKIWKELSEEVIENDPSPTTDPRIFDPRTARQG